MWLKTSELHSMDAGTSSATTVENEPDVSTKKWSGDSDLPVRKKRKYNEEYIKFGFTRIGDENEPKGLCVECEHVMHNSSLIPAKLKKHLETTHPTFQNKNVEYFKRKCNELKNRKKAFINFVRNDNDNALAVSYRVSYRIAQQGEAYTIAEKLIKPCVKDVVATMIGEEHAKLVDCIPLSDIIISRCVKGMSDFCEIELIRHLQASVHGFTIQLDETTDIAGLEILLVIYPWNGCSRRYANL